MPESTPAQPVFSEVPQRVDRKTGAELIQKHFGFRVASRSLQAWPVTWSYVNGYATCATADLFAAAQAKLDVAKSRSGKTDAPEPEAETVSPPGTTTGRPPAVGCPA